MVVHFGSFALDVPRRRLSRGPTSIHVTPKAFDLLQILIEEAPRIVEKRELHERLWPRTFVSDATLVGLVKELRRALDDRDPESPVIRTAHRVGYAFCPDVVRGAPTHAAPVYHWIVLDGRRTALEEGEHVIGRNPASHVCLDAPGVSRSHARVVVDGPVVRLTDLGSKNGTTVNDQPVTGDVELRDGDRIAFGSAVVVYRSSAAGVSTETHALRAQGDRSTADSEG
jgi:DNA-binding winged helix-turn-helix (wHTH) protein